jgi:hypothetical protein
MIITHTINGDGYRRIYLGGRASLECWIEPNADGKGWAFHAETAPGAYPLPDETMKAWAKHTLLTLSYELGVAPGALASVPFERIATLHMSDPTDYRRAAVNKRQSREHAFVASTPQTRKPDVSSPHFAHRHRR